MSKNNDKYISVQLIDDSDDEIEVGFEVNVITLKPQWMNQYL